MNKNYAGVREKAWQRQGITDIDGKNLSYFVFEKIIELQNNRCAICGMSGDWQSLSGDHCHICGVIRGGLCWRCNRRVVPTVERGHKYRGQKQTEIVKKYLQYPPYFVLIGKEHMCFRKA